MKKLLSACAVAAAFVALPASAQWYAGVGVGSSKFSGIDGSVPGLALSGGNTNKTSVKVYGGYQITPMWGAEAQYTDLGRRDLTVSGTGFPTFTQGVKASQYSLAGTGTFPLSQSFAIIGKLGVTQNKVDGGGFNDSKSGLLAGIGVSYAFAPKLSARLEYEDFGRFTKDNGFNGSSVRANNLSLSLQYAF